MNYSHFKNSFLLTLLGSAASVPAIYAADKPKNPNIVYILCDDLGYGDVSCYNSDSKINTTNIDRLAQSGVRFNEYHSGSSLSTPTRYGIITGRYAWRSTLKESVLFGYDKSIIEPKRETVASFLRKQSYTTACIGKWHLGWNWANIDAGQDKVDFTKPITQGPEDFGFDYSYNIVASLDMFPYVYVENSKPLGIPKDTCKEGSGLAFYRAGITAPGFKHEEVLTNFTEKALGYISENAHNKNPFFLYLPLTAPHTPILPTKEFQGKSDLTPYGDFVLMCDDILKQVVDRLKEKDIYDNTIIIFTSDNGCSRYAGIDSMIAKGHSPSKNYRGSKSDIFDGGHRVPFIVSWPKGIKSSVSDKIVCSTDLFRTVAEITGAPVDDNAAEDSYSFLSELTGKPSRMPMRESVIHHSNDGSFAIRKGPWKLIMCSHSGGWSYPTPESEAAKTLPPLQLYNMDTDPSEKTNVYNQYPGIVSELKELITKQVLEGRCTPGKAQPNTGGKHWKQLTWIKD